ncbi:MAG: hypothetical protein ICV87_03385 [Gemmatimonadetes bacterium]|nr:hypothetical protein [Gemmatimonadota bacterium]
MTVIRIIPDEIPRPSERRAWVAPELKDLPRLTDLTLQTGGLIPCGGPGGGSTVC